MERKVCTYCGKEGHRASSCPTRPREREIERYLVKRVKEKGGEIRKVQWIGRRGAPDRLVMLPWPAHHIFVELKRPGEGLRYDQFKEHCKMLAFGIDVRTIDSIEKVEELLA